MEGVFISVNSFLVGKYPCLWCLITYETMQLSCQDPRHGHIEKRNVKNIEEDYNKFVADGCVTSWQKFYHNVIHQKLLDIEPPSRPLSQKPMRPAIDSEPIRVWGIIVPSFCQGCFELILICLRKYYWNDSFVLREYNNLRCYTVYHKSKIF